ncbi:type II toxin-antitoxin system VapC family toxin [Salinibius halmophilus]|uniref:type II toxin-antitoxin system VapC family toxin n=1 Tax=Salinibius halmophilus TaxID=1853216 RepID=UPI001F3C6910|nr:type II toxin-antitoxin system VapC family toxin [Salinibius halmophilus]
MNIGVRSFFESVDSDSLYISSITVGELRRGVELIRHRGDAPQASLLEEWLTGLLSDFERNILSFDHEEAQIWGKLRVPHHENAIDKLIAATALIYGFTLVTLNIKDFINTGVTLHNPFSDE